MAKTKSERIRTSLSRFLGVLLIGYVFMGTSYWEHKSVVPDVLFFLGIILASIASLGRLWCTLYIAGYKNKRLIMSGPYSLCRNPLYFFSCLGALGVGFSTETISVPVLILTFFACYYPVVITQEEKKLRAIHGGEFDAYCRKTPVFWPKWSLLHEPEEYAVKPVIFRKHLADALWFIWLIGIIELIEAAHENGLLVAKWVIY